MSVKRRRRDQLYSVTGSNSTAPAATPPPAPSLPRPRYYPCPTIKTIKIAATKIAKTGKSTLAAVVVAEKGRRSAYVEQLRERGGFTAMMKEEMPGRQRRAYWTGCKCSKRKTGMITVQARARVEGKENLGCIRLAERSWFTIFPTLSLYFTPPFLQSLVLTTVQSCRRHRVLPFAQ